MINILAGQWSIVNQIYSSFKIQKNGLGIKKKNLFKFYLFFKKVKLKFEQLLEIFA